jgi:hypothetical protein
MKKSDLFGLQKNINYYFSIYLNDQTKIETFLI